MRLITSFLLAFSLVITYGQSASMTSVDNLETHKTEKHINIPGTRLFIVPPEDFSISDNFIGLIKENISAIQVMDLDGGNFYTNSANYTKQGFEKKGIKVLDFKELTINGYPCKYICMQGDTSAKVLGFVFGDTTFSVMVMATYPSKDEIVEKSLEIALQTIYYEKGLTIDPFISAYFKLDDSESIFKFFRSSANLFIYSIGGKENKEKVINLL
jgi:hypothetical protein